MNSITTRIDKSQFLLLLQKYYFQLINVTSYIIHTTVLTEIKSASKIEVFSESFKLHMFLGHTFSVLLWSLECKITRSFYFIGLVFYLCIHWAMNEAL